ncbi:hypothetical protein MC885_012088 [Smutsia gigantea]|nr:hypothetical protein MC885_012088 [Smutsia gigantea]
MQNSLRSLRNSAAKKRAKLSGSPDLESPDSAIKLDLTVDSPSRSSSPNISSYSEKRREYTGKRTACSYTREDSAPKRRVRYGAATRRDPSPPPPQRTGGRRGFRARREWKCTPRSSQPR